MSGQHINDDVEHLQCLDLFDSNPTGSQILACRKTVISSEPLSAASTQMRFRIPAITKEFTRLSSATIEFTYKVATATGADVGAQNAFVGFPGDHGDLLIKKGKVTIAGNNIIESTSNYGLSSFVQTLLSQDNAAKRTSLEAEGWKEDAVSGLVPDTAGNPAVAARLARRTAIQNGTHQTIIIQPKFGIFQQNKLIPPQTAMDLEFEFANNAYFFNAPDGTADGRLRLVPMKAELSLHRYSVRDTVYKALTKINLGSANKPGTDYKYPYQQLECLEATVSQGVTKHMIQYPTVRKRPNKVLVLFVPQVCHAGHYQHNPTHFVHAGVSDIVLKFHGIEMGRLQSNFTTGAVTQAYDSLMRAVPHKSLEASSNGISLADFRTKYTIFGWDTTYGYGATHDIQEDVDITVEITFRDATNVVMTAVVLTETNRLLTLPMNRAEARVI